jgi:hypothetical protein
MGILVPGLRTEDVNLNKAGHLRFVLWLLLWARKILISCSTLEADVVQDLLLRDIW